MNRGSEPVAGGCTWAEPAPGRVKELHGRRRPQRYQSTYPIACSHPLWNRVISEAALMNLGDIGFRVRWSAIAVTRICDILLPSTGPLYRPVSGPFASAGRIPLKESCASGKMAKSNIVYDTPMPSFVDDGSTSPCSDTHRLVGFPSPPPAARACRRSTSPWHTGGGGSGRHDRSRPRRDPSPIRSASSPGSSMSRPGTAHAGGARADGGADGARRRSWWKRAGRSLARQRALARALTPRMAKP